MRKSDIRELWVTMATVVICALLVPVARTLASSAAPSFESLTHIRCAQPVALKGGINTWNYILCADGTKVPLGGNTLTGPRTGLVYRCYLENKPFEVWTYGVVGVSYRFVQITCNGAVLLDYEHGIADLARSGSGATPGWLAVALFVPVAVLAAIIVGLARIARNRSPI